MNSANAAKIRPWLVMLALLLPATDALACPFCNAGSEETAAFILTIFGFFAVAAALVLAWSWRLGAFNADKDIGKASLDAEDLS